MTNKATQQIIEQLKDSSHPPIVLLDGAWGIGKTHLIDNELRPLIESNPQEFGDYHYVSAFGIKSVTEFQDQIVSLYISSQEEGSKYLDGLTRLSGKLARMCGADASEAGVIQGVISGTTGFLRQKAIQNMKDITLVVDDLERLTDEKLISDIMGTCLRFAEHNKIKIIAVANATAFQDKTKVEKSFSDVIKLTRTTEELLTIIADIYDGKLDAMVEHTFFQTINHAQIQKLDINNLRVLQRAVNRTIKLINRIRLIEGIDERRSAEKLTQHIVLITLYGYANKLDIDAFVSILESAQKWQFHRLAEAVASRNASQNEREELTKGEQQQKVLFDQLTSLLNGFACSDTLAEYCFTNLIPELSDEEFIERFQLPRLAKPIDIFKTHSFYSFTSEEEFEEGITQLVDLLFTMTNVNWSDWITCCDTYLFMHERGYFEDSNIDELSKRLEERVLEDGVIDLDTVNQSRFSFRDYSSNQISTTNFNKAIEEVNLRSKTKQREAITDSFLKDWRHTIYKSQSYIENQPFFHNIDNERLAEAIAQWSAMEVAEFIGFMRKRYCVINDPEKDLLELPALIQLSKRLDLRRECMSGRLQKGVLKELIDELNVAITKIETRQKQN
ncbi:TPA: P-loop NTPase fold protein [Vibrio diabolicus]